MSWVGTPAWPKTVVAFVLLYACATLQFIRYYVTYTSFYLRLPAYLAGQERLPFQERILPAILIRLFYRSPLWHYTTAHDKGAFTPERAPLFVISLLAIVVAGIYVQRLYSRLTRTRALSFLVYPVFLFAMMWTYSIHLEANFSYPYDMLAVAFFSAGLYYIYTRQFWPLLVVVAIGTFNRETTLLLIPVYILDAVSAEPASEVAYGPGARQLAAKMPWVRTALLFAVWFAIKAFLAYKFAHNDSSENYVRLRENIGRLKPRLWPALLNVCGYILPLVVIFHRRIRPKRFRNYLWVLPLWFAIMFYTGVIVETRVYGELCPYVAVAAVLIMEHRLASTEADTNGNSMLRPQNTNVVT